MTIDITCVSPKVDLPINKQLYPKLALFHRVTHFQLILYALQSVLPTPIQDVTQTLHFFLTFQPFLCKLHWLLSMLAFVQEHATVGVLAGFAVFVGFS